MPLERAPCSAMWTSRLGPEGVVLSLQIRAFVKNKEGLAQQELNQSPLPFVESASQPGTAACPEAHRQRLFLPVSLVGRIAVNQHRVKSG